MALCNNIYIAAALFGIVAFGQLCHVPLEAKESELKEGELHMCSGGGWYLHCARPHQNRLTEKCRNILVH